MTDDDILRIRKEVVEYETSRFSEEDAIEFARRIMAEAQRGAKPMVWIQSDHLLNLKRNKIFLCRCSDHQAMNDFVPLYAAPQRTAQQEPVGTQATGSTCGIENPTVSAAAATLQDMERNISWYLPEELEAAATPRTDGRLYIRLSMAQVASCKCGTKTDQPDAHDEMCPYRLYQESAIRIAELSRENTELRAALEAAEKRTADYRHLVSIPIDGATAELLNRAEAAEARVRELENKHD